MCIYIYIYEISTTVTCSPVKPSHRRRHGLRRLRPDRGPGAAGGRHHPVHLCHQRGPVGSMTHNETGEAVGP